MKPTAKKTTRAKPKAVKAKAPRRARIGITMEPRELERIDALISTVAESEAAREFGVEVDRSLVLRIAVIRGLQIMESGAASPRSVTVDAVASKPNKAKPAPGLPESGPTESQDDLKRDTDGNIRPADGWNEWKSIERIPQGHTEVHEYYVNHGWKRYWGKLGEEVINFYWTGDERLRDVEPFGGKGPKGKGMIIQSVGPYGTGHLIPHSWVVE